MSSPGSGSGSSAERDAGRAVYAISVAAELVGSVPQTLRLYESRGLLTPTRSEGGTRRYSDEDLDRLREIGRLLGEGLNLAGVASVLALQAANEVLRTELAEARTQARGTDPAHRADAARKRPPAAPPAQGDAER